LKKKKEKKKKKRNVRNWGEKCKDRRLLNEILKQVKTHKNFNAGRRRRGRKKRRKSRRRRREEVRNCREKCKEKKTV
jgi:hypothetical protein